MKRFLDENFLLKNGCAVELFNEYAKDMPIFDFHCHLEAKDIWENKKFENISQVWLGGDHYKWRVMRAIGISEEYITGKNTSDYDKFLKWAKTVPQLIGNPLYHWTHLELQRFFGIKEILNEENAPMIWEKANELLKNNDFTPRGLIEKSNVFAICTTDDPADTLEYHIKLKEEGIFKTKVLPAMRPDKVLQIESEGFTDYLKRLSDVSGIEIGSYRDLKEALRKRLEFFNEIGCRACDHAFNYVPYNFTSDEEIEEIFKKRLENNCISREDEDKYKTVLMIFLSEIYSRYDWAMELHVGALRNNNEKMMEKLGPDTGYDAINDYSYAPQLSKLLNHMEKRNHLPKTMLFNLNPKDNQIFTTILGCFSGEKEGMAKMQYGSAWWFLDTKEGMTRQIKDLASTGVLSKFVGMLTDSRSFLSYPRHEYFRRILCNIIGEMVENGEYPYEKEALGNMVKDICFNNAVDYFNSH